MSRKITTYLVVRADGNVRTRTSKPARGTLAVDEVAVPIVVHMPDGWGEITFEPVNPDAIIVGEAPEPDGEAQS